MTNQAITNAGYHTMAADHCEAAAKHHREAAKEHEAGDHEKAGHRAEVAHGHMCHATDHTAVASKQHAEEHEAVV